MDHINRFEGRVTYALLRTEYGAGLFISTGLLIAHLGEIRWLPFTVLFSYIDVIGYIPGALAFRRSKQQGISRIYYVLYNTMHSLAVQAVVAALWCWVIGPEWALLALSIHLCGDRAIFGNFLKPFSAPFEPKPMKAFQEFERRICATTLERSEISSDSRLTTPAYSHTNS